MVVRPGGLTPSGNDLPQSALFLLQTGQHTPKALQSGFQILDDVLRNIVRLRKVIQITQGFIPQPEDVQAGLIPLKDVVEGITPPPTIRVVLAPGFFPLVAFARFVALDEFLKVLVPEGISLQRMVDVGAVVVDPDRFRPGLCPAWAAIEEQDVGLHPVGVEDAGGQAEDGVEVGGFQ